ncbi:MAG: NADH-quinone oxidoreductase subunit J [Gammaproteobacteria bacterium]|nr:NADH-quinone oxidoreductase subunit J [Gammaproteobacteria bacterium]
MSLEQIVFYAFSALLVLSATAVITVRNPVHAALFLVLTFFTCAAVWLLLEAEFLAIVLVLVYVGAVMVLFLFVVMMLDINYVPLREGFMRHLPLGIAVAVVVVLEMALVVGPRYFGLEAVPVPPPHDAQYSNTTELGSVLYTDYFYPFQIAGAVLVLAIVAAIALTLRRRPDNKSIDPGLQMRVTRDQRVRLVKMKAESPVDRE